MTAITAVSNVAATGLTAAVSRLAASGPGKARAPISPVSPVVPHKNPPAGLLLLDPSSPEMDLSGQPVEQMRALHQFRANMQMFQAPDPATQSTISVEA